MYDEKLNKWGKPQVFKDMKLYPLMIDEEEYYMMVSEFLGYPKHVILDKNISKASYLGFMVTHLLTDLDKNKRFNALMGRVFHGDVTIEYSFRKRPPTLISDIKYEVIVNANDAEISISENEFDEVRRIILEQNGISLKRINEYNPVFEKYLINANMGKPPMTFEEELFSFCDNEKILINDLKKYTMYQFKKHFQRLVLRMDYELFKPLETSGQIKMNKGTIKHFLDHMPEKGRYDDVLVKKSDYLKNGDVFKASKQGGK